MAVVDRVAVYEQKLAEAEQRSEEELIQLVRASRERPRVRWLHQLDRHLTAALRRFKNAEGRRRCYWCLSYCRPPRRSYCSVECLHEWRLRNEYAYFIWLVEQRDHGVCAGCGLDTVALRSRLLNEIRAIRQTHQGTRAWGAHIAPLLQPHGVREEQVWRRRLWEADHVLPVHQGGGCCGLENIQTLCIPCHKEKSRTASRSS